MQPVTLESIGRISVIRIDDGKANALGPEAIAGLTTALDDAGDGPVAILGREGVFSAGFDLETMQEGPESARNLVYAGARMLMRLFGHPRPVVAGCTGHAIAAGALMLLASDLRIGAVADAKIGLNEVAIGMPLPIFGVELARARLSRRHFTRATSLATLYQPAEALDAGFLDELVGIDELETTVLARAAGLGDLSRSGFAATRRNDRQPTIDAILASLEEDLASFGVAS